MKDAAPVAAASVARLWPNATRATYRLALDSSLAVAGSKSVAFTLTSDWQLEVRPIGNGSVQFVAVLPNARFIALDPAAQPKFDELAKELARPSAFTLRDGALGELRYTPGATPFGSAIQRTLAAAIQFAPPQNNSQDTRWTVRESDATGNYLAEYERTQKPGELLKRKLRYEAVGGGKAGIGNLTANLTPEVVESQGSVSLVETPGVGKPGAARLERIAYTEKLNSKLSAAASATSQTQLSLVFDKAMPAMTVQEWQRILAETRVFDPNQPVAETNYDSARIGSYTFEKAVTELEQQAGDPKQNQVFGSVRGKPEPPELVAEREARLRGQSTVFGALTALLRSQPNNVPLALARIRAKSPASRPLIDGLSSAGTPSAQLALIDVVEDEKLDVNVRRAATFALGRTSHATHESVATLGKHAENPLLRVHALYGLGTLARRLREAGTLSHSAEIADILKGALERAKAPGEQVDALRAIANSGDAALFDAAQAQLTAASPKVRVAAVDAIRLMKHPAVDGIVATSLLEGNDETQIAALDAISVREPTATLVKALVSSPPKLAKPATRVRLIRVMGEWLARRPELRAPLTHLSSADTSEDVRNAAKQALRGS